MKSFPGWQVICGGLLDRVVLHGVDLQTALSALSSITGGETNLENLDHFQGREFVIQSDPIQEVVVDGEPHGETPCRVSVHTAALQVLVEAE